MMQKQKLSKIMRILMTSLPWSRNIPNLDGISTLRRKMTSYRSLSQMERILRSTAVSAFRQQQLPYEEEPAKKSSRELEAENP
jgi:hypothetical protein